MLIVHGDDQIGNSRHTLVFQIVNKFAQNFRLKYLTASSERIKSVLYFWINELQTS